MCRYVACGRFCGHILAFIPNTAMCRARYRPRRPADILEVFTATQDCRVVDVLIMHAGVRIIVLGTMALEAIHICA